MGAKNFIGHRNLIKKRYAYKLDLDRMNDDDVFYATPTARRICDEIVSELKKQDPLRDGTVSPSEGDMWICWSVIRLFCVVSQEGQILVDTIYPTMNVTANNVNDAVSIIKRNINRTVKVEH
jgi:hypothetical protein